MENKTIRLLWTGGWDSSFRLLQLVCHHDVTIAPYYVVDTDRRSTLTEIKNMGIIKKLVAQRFPAAKILPTKFFPINEIDPDANITENFKELRQISYLGTQYEWLARLAKQENIDDLELGIHIDDKAHVFIKGYVSGDHLAPDAPADLQTVFGSFRFPILNLSKVDMLNIAKQDNTVDIMLKTWFCFSPNNGKPCGVCNPCQYAIEEGMAFRFSPAALLKYRLFGKPKSLLKKYARKYYKLT